MQKSAEAVLGVLRRGTEGPNIESGGDFVSLEAKLGEQKIPQGSQRQEGVVHTPGPTVVRSFVPAQTSLFTCADYGLDALMERVVDPTNMFQALRRVEQNKGAPGVDGMNVSELRLYYSKHGERLREELLSGKYKPQPVRRTQIPKANGSGQMRELGIPSVVDRLVQQAILQVLSPVFEPTFSDCSYGFRPGRKASDAVSKAQEHIRAGYKVCVDIDLENFFNRVNHDILMSRVARKVHDKRLLRLIRSYLNAGIMDNGVCLFNDAGVPQGGPLSPLLSNIMLDDLDKEMEKRGHRFVRYADDGNTYVKSLRAGERVLASVTKFLEQRLKLKVNVSKSAVAKPSQRKFLGFSFTSQKDARIRISPQALQKFKAKVRELTNRSWGISLGQRIQRLNSFTRGWLGYFRTAETSSVVKMLDSWLHRRMRQCVLKQWKQPKTKYRNLRRLGLSQDFAAQVAYSRKGSWRLSLTHQLHAALDKKYWHRQGLLELASEYERLRKAL
jgi:RNA-directed DNA polymerase